MARLFLFHNGASPAAAAMASVTTGTTIKTLMQVLHATDDMRVKEWGVSFDGTTAASAIKCELIDTGTVAATVTAFVANDITLLSSPGGAASGVTLSTTGSGYTASAEGTVVAPVRVGDMQLVSPTGGWFKQFMLGNEFEVPATHCLRVRVSNTGGGAAVNVWCYVTVEI